MRPSKVEQLQQDVVSEVEEMCEILDTCAPLIVVESLPKEVQPTELDYTERLTRASRNLTDIMERVTSTQRRLAEEHDTLDALNVEPSEVPGIDGDLLKVVTVAQLIALKNVRSLGDLLEYLGVLQTSQMEEIDVILNNITSIQHMK